MIHYGGGMLGSMARGNPWDEVTPRQFPEAGPFVPQGPINMPPIHGGQGWGVGGMTGGGAPMGGGYPQPGIGAFDWARVGAAALTDFGNWWETRAERKRREREFELSREDEIRHRRRMGASWNEMAGR